MKKKQNSLAWDFLSLPLYVNRLWSLSTIERNSQTKTFRTTSWTRSTGNTQIIHTSFSGQTKSMYTRISRFRVTTPSHTCPYWFNGGIVSTVDFDSSNLSSNLFRTRPYIKFQSLGFVSKFCQVICQQLLYEPYGFSTEARFHGVMVSTLDSDSSNLSSSLSGTSVFKKELNFC